MEILSLDYEQPMSLTIGTSTITFTVFKSPELGVVSIGVDAPRTLSVNREEIYKLKKEKGQV